MKIVEGVNLKAKPLIFTAVLSLKDQNKHITFKGSLNVDVLNAGNLTTKAKMKRSYSVLHKNKIAKSTIKYITTFQRNFK